MSPLAGEIQLTQNDFDRIAKFVYEICGITLNQTKKELVRARLAKRLRILGLENYSEYLERVMADPEGQECFEFIDSLSTNLTSFFRENDHFIYLSQTLLPKLLRDKQSTRRIRGWSSACSSGEEPYTISIVTNEVLSKAGANNWDVKLLATDISTRVLRKAQAGVYDMERTKAVEPVLRGKYFEPRTLGGEPHLAVSPALRNQIVFNRLNLIENWPFTGPFDFIFCRNVMIYFDKPTQQKLVNRFHDVLAPGGILFTGHSESLTGIDHKFKFVKATIYQK
jgi:chemotaxis protein methyltransferase CheR